MSHVSSVQIVGIDPGLVHTGMVRFTFDTGKRRVSVKHHVVDGLDEVAIAGVVRGWKDARVDHFVFVEMYVPRQRLSTDIRMVQGERRIIDAVPFAVTVRNTGSRQVVKPGLLQLVGAGWFPTTHHADLQAAARVALFGMLKRPELNKVLATLVEDHMRGDSWTIEN